jgi:hypothetical protein
VWAGYLGIVDSSVTPGAVRAGAVGLTVAALGWVAIFGGGRIVRSALRVARPALSGAGGWLDDLVAGHVLATAVLLPMAATGALRPGAVAAAGALLCAGWLLPGSPSAPTTPSRLTVLVGASLLLGPGLFIALAPPIDTDELYWHLGVPAEILRGRGLPGGWEDPLASRPLPLQLAHAALLSLGGTAGVKAFHWFGALFLLRGIFDGVAARAPGSAHGPALAVALLVGSWSFLAEAGLAHDNLFVALLVLAAVEAAMRCDRPRLALAIGAALAMKYTSAPAVVAALGLYGWGRARDVGVGRALGGAASVGALSLLLVAPWWVRNWIDGVHPLFPFAGWPADSGLVYVWPEKYGVGHGLLDWLRLPYDLVFRARTDSVVFLGRIHPAWLFAMPAVLYAGVHDRTVRALLVASGVAVTGWFLGAQWMRHLLPVAPLLGLGWGLGLARLPDRVLQPAWIAWLLLLPTQTLDLFVSGADAVPVATGRESRESFLGRQVRGWPAIAWVNAHTPPEARIALLFTGDRFLVERHVVLGSVEDHTPSRFLLWSYEHRALEHLRAIGVDYVLVQRVGFLAKTYPFLTPAAFDLQLREPERTLARALADQATLVFEEGRHAVWALDEAEARR